MCEYELHRVCVCLFATFILGVVAATFFLADISKTVAHLSNGAEIPPVCQMIS